MTHEPGDVVRADAMTYGIFTELLERSAKAFTSPGGAAAPAFAYDHWRAGVEERCARHMFQVSQDRRRRALHDRA